MLALYDPALSRPYFDEAIDLVHAIGDRRSLCQIFS